MGNRAIITTQNDFDNNGIGVYVHWNGGYDSVSAFLKYCELRGFRPPEEDGYGWARLCQIIGNFFGGDLSIGIDALYKLPLHTCDNGVYIIEKWKIVGRKYTYDKKEQMNHDLYDMVCDINKAQPRNDRLDKQIIKQMLKGENNNAEN